MEKRRSLVLFLFYGQKTRSSCSCFMNSAARTSVTKNSGRDYTTREDESKSTINLMNMSINTINMSRNNRNIIY